MHLVDFIIDLGDCFARFTGRVLGQQGSDYKVTYYCPVTRQYLTIDLVTEQIAGSWHEAAGFLPIMPEITEKRSY